MSELVADCPRCKAKQMTFDLISQIPTVVHYDWQQWYEAFCICRSCSRSTIFVLSQSEYSANDLLTKTTLSDLNFAVNKVLKVEGHVSLKDQVAVQPPPHLSENIEAAFREGAACQAIGSFNAAAAMFRLCVDLATKPLLPEENSQGLNNATRRNLGLRLPWLFDSGVLPEALRELSSCIKDDGNDGAHDGSLGEEDAADVADFTFELLERLFTEPERLRLAKQRREERRKPKPE